VAQLDQYEQHFVQDNIQLIRQGLKTITDFLGLKIGKLAFHDTQPSFHGIHPTQDHTVIGRNLVSQILNLVSQILNRPDNTHAVRDLGMGGLHRNKAGPTLLHFFGCHDVGGMDRQNLPNFVFLGCIVDLVAERFISNNCWSYKISCVTALKRWTRWYGIRKGHLQDWRYNKIRVNADAVNARAKIPGTKPES
jgi:hypothetical protein